MSVFPYTGNKACIYPLIEDMTPDHDVYIEAFCGSAEVFFQKRPVKKEIINEINRNKEKNNKKTTFLWFLFCFVKKDKIPIIINLNP